MERFKNTILLFAAKRHRNQKEEMLLLHCEKLTHLPPGRNGRHAIDDISIYMFVYEKFCILFL